MRFLKPEFPVPSLSQTRSANAVNIFNVAFHYKLKVTQLKDLLLFLLLDNQVQVLIFSIPGYLRTSLKSVTG